MEYFENFNKFKQKNAPFYSITELEQLFKNNTISIENIELVENKKYSKHYINVIQSEKNNEINDEINSFFISFTNKNILGLDQQIILIDNKIVFFDKKFHETFIIELENIESFEIISEFENSKDSLFYKFIFNFDLKNKEDTVTFQFLIYNLFEINSKLYMFNIDELQTKNNLFDKINEYYFNYLDSKKYNKI